MPESPTGPNESATWIPVSPSLTRDEYLQQYSDEIDSFGRKISEYRSQARLISSDLKELLADMAVSNYSTYTMFQSRSRLIELISIVKALKNCIPTHVLDVAVLNQFKASIDDYLDVSLSDYERCDPCWEELFEQYVGNLRTSLPLVADWERTQTPNSIEAAAATMLEGDGRSEALTNREVLKSDEIEPPLSSQSHSDGDTDQGAGKLVENLMFELGGFAEAGTPVPARFREHGKENGLPFGPIVGNSKALFFALTGTKSPKTKSLLQKHMNQVAFIRKVAPKSYEMFVRDRETLDRIRQNLPHLKQLSQVPQKESY